MKPCSCTAGVYEYPGADPGPDYQWQQPQRDPASQAGHHAGAPSFYLSLSLSLSLSGSL